jgi:hypothetical protein
LICSPRVESSKRGRDRIRNRVELAAGGGRDGGLERLEPGDCSRPSLDRAKRDLDRIGAVGERNAVGVKPIARAETPASSAASRLLLSDPLPGSMSAYSWENPPSVSVLAELRFRRGPGLGAAGSRRLIGRATATAKE